MDHRTGRARAQRRRGGRCPEPHARGHGQDGEKVDPAAWLSAHHYGYRLSYQPAGRFWYFQALTGAVLIASAIVFTLVTIWLARRRG